MLAVELPPLPLPVELLPTVPLELLLADPLEEVVIWLWLEVPPEEAELAVPEVGPDELVATAVLPPVEPLLEPLPEEAALDAARVVGPPPLLELPFPGGTPGA